MKLFIILHLLSGNSIAVKKSEIQTLSATGCVIKFKLHIFAENEDVRAPCTKLQVTGETYFIKETLEEITKGLQ